MQYSSTCRFLWDTAFSLKVYPKPTVWAPFSLNENGIRGSSRGYSIRENAFETLLLAEEIL